MYYSLAVTGDPVLARLTKLAAAPLGLDLRFAASDFHTAVEHFPFDGAARFVVDVARSAEGQIVSYPVTALAPAPGGIETTMPTGMDSEVLQELQSTAISAAVEQSVIGAVSVAFSEDGHLLAQHLGPSEPGLWTLDAAHTSVFQNHLRALLNLPLGSPEPLAPAAVTVTATGGTERDPTGALQHLHARDRQARIHLYGQPVFEGEPLGHVTCFGHDVDDLRRRAHHAANYLRGVDDR